MSDQVLASKAQTDQSDMERMAAIAGFLPGLTASAHVLWLDVNDTYYMEPIQVPPGTSQDVLTLLSALDFSALTSVPDHDKDLTLTVYEPLSMLPQIGMYNQIARNNKKLSDLQYDLTRDNIALYMGGAYYNVLIAGRKVKAYERALEQTSRIVTDAQKMLSLGMITKSDLLRFQIYKSNVEVELLQAQQDLAQGRSAVARLLKMDAAGVEYQDAEPPLRTPKDLDWYLARGRENRKDLKIVNLSVNNARRARDATYMEMFPKVNAVASVDYNDDGLMTTPDRTYSAGFTMEWNFWNWGRDLNTARAARFAAKRAEHMAASSETEIMLAVEKAWRDDLVAHKQVEAQRTNLEQAEESFRIEQNRFNVGKTTTTDMLAAQTQLTSAETGYNASLYGAALADAALLLAVGDQPFPEMMGGSSNE